MLVSQISVAVESRFSMLKEEMKQEGKSGFSEECRQVVNTYSSATLHQAARIVVSQEPDAKVFRYVKRSEVDEIFRQRKEKILDFTRSADKALKEVRLADALKYYYWALTLLRSHPDGAAIALPGDASRPLQRYLPETIGRVFEGIEIHAAEIKDEPGQRTIRLHITYGGNPVENFDYSYWDGKNFSVPVSAKDGIGFLEFFGDQAHLKKETQVRAEYVFAGEARIDRELEDVLAQLDAIPFRNNLYQVKFERGGSGPPGVEEPRQHPVAPEMAETFTLPEYRNRIDKILTSIRDKNYQSAASLFTPGGYEVFDRLLRYGEARLLRFDTLSAIRMGRGVMVRGPVMSFSFPNNAKKFVEDVVFYFNEEMKVETLSFGLNGKALLSILSHQRWSATERMTLISFLEHYKTAYALKRLDFIRSIFADDALIITGSVVRVKPDAENLFRNNPIVRYNRYNKEQYLKALEHTFAGNEFINIEFEESLVRKGGSAKELFGIQIKQNYYSSSYGDQGYLFLLVDFEDPGEPLIHVRTWQPTRNADGTIYGIEDF